MESDCVAQVCQSTGEQGEITVGDPRSVYTWASGFLDGSQPSAQPVDTGDWAATVIMTVNPGFGGQKFIEDMTEKIRELRNINKDIDIQVDGGINAETAKKVKEAGANILVAGSYVFSGNYKEKIEEIVENEKLFINEKKTKEYNLLDSLSSNNLKNNSINYLGYEIGSNKKQLVIELSKNKIDKYFKRIKLSFENFSEKKHHNRKKTFKLLSARIKYLTSNTKLRNNKDKVFVGIYYSNPFLNSDKSLKKLQDELDENINQTELTDKQKQKIKAYSFIDGFKKRTFQVLPLKNKINKNHNRILQFGITEITSIWKE